MGKWNATVKANRVTPHLSFSAEASENTRRTVTVDSLMDEFKPSSALELEMAAAFHKLAPPPTGKDGLPDDAVTSFDEFCSRQSEVEKLKALMSYHDKASLLV